MTTKAQREKMTLMELIIEHQKVSERLERIKRGEDEDVERKTKALVETMRDSVYKESESLMKKESVDEFINGWKEMFSRRVDEMIDTALTLK